MPVFASQYNGIVLGTGTIGNKIALYLDILKGGSSYAKRLHRPYR